MEPILSASNISKSFIGVRALNNIDLRSMQGNSLPCGRKRLWKINTCKMHFRRIYTG